jgi:hypothetical protein
MRRLLWFPVAFGVLAWLLIVPLFGGCEDEVQSERRTPKPVRPVPAPSPDVDLPKAA